MGTKRTILQSLGLGTLAADDEPEPSSPTLTVPSRTDRPAITLDSASSLPDAFRAIQIITTMGSQLTLNAWRGKALVPRQPQVIRQPDPWREQEDWTERVLTGLVGDGNAFLLKTLDPNIDAPTPIAAPALNPFAVTIRRDRKGNKLYDYAGREKFVTYTADQIEHVWLNQFPGRDRGVSPITACRLTLAGALDTRKYASSFFDTGAIPPGYLSSDQTIDEATAKDMKSWWHEGESDQIKVVGKGLTFHPILIKPEDAQWIEAQRFNSLQIANMFGIPPIMLAAAVEGSSLTYQNLTMVNEQLVTTLLRPVYLSKVERVMRRLLPLGQTARFDTTDLLRQDDKTRMETHGLAIKAGVYDATYARNVIEKIDGPAPKPPAPVAPEPKEPAA